MIGSGNPNTTALLCIKPAIAAVAAIFPDPRALSRLEQLRDLDRRQRRLLNRLWTEIKLY